MANTEIVKTIKIETGNGERSVKQLKQEINTLRDALLNVEKGSKDWEDITRRLVEDQDDLNSVIKAGKTEMNAAADSIVGMEQHYKSLYNTYKLLSEEQRNSSFGKEMANQLNTLSEKLNDSKKEVGNYKDNIGRYANDIMGAFGKMSSSLKSMKGGIGGVISGAQGFSTAFSSLSKAAGKAVPILGAVLLALNLLKKGFDRVKQAINDNEELSMRLESSMASLKPVTDALANAFDWVAQKAMGVVEWFYNLIDSVVLGVAAISDFIGITDGLEDRLKAEQERYKELVKAQHAYTLAKREALKLNAKGNAEVERLRDEAAEEDNVTKKLELLNEAKEKQEIIDKRNLDLAKENLRLLQEEAKATNNSAEANQKLAEAEAAVYEAEASVNRNRRQYTKQIKSVNNQILSEQKEFAAKIKAEADAVINEVLERNRSQQASITAKYNEDLKKLQKQQEQLIKQGKSVKDIMDSIKSLTDNYLEDINRLKDAEESAMRESYYNSREAFIATMNYPQALIEAVELVEERIEGVTVDLFQLFKIKGDPKGTNGTIEYLQSMIDELEKVGENIQFTDENTKKLLPEWEKFNTLNGLSITNLDDLKGALYGYIKLLSDAQKSLNDYNHSTEQLQREVLMASNYYGNGLLNFLFDNDEIDAAWADFFKDYDRSLERIGFDYEFYYQHRERLKELELQSNVGRAKRELDEFTGDLNQRLELEKQYQEAMNALEDYYLDAKLTKLDLERESVDKLQDAYFNLGATAVDSLSSIIDSIASITKATIADTKEQITNGKLTEREIEKKKKGLKTIEAIQLAVAVAGIAADTASGIMGVWKNYGAELVLNAETAAATGPAAAATKAALDAKSLTMAGINTGIISSAGAANLAAAIAGSISNFRAINQLGESGSGAATTGSVPSVIETNPYSYTRELQTDTEREETLNRPIWVSVKDIQDGLNQSQVVDRESTF